MKETSNDFILQFLRQQHLEGKREVFGGTIEDYMRAKNGMKGDTVSRILRFMREDGLIERIMMPRKDGKRANVAYRLLNENQNPIAIKEIGLEELFAVGENEGRRQERDMLLRDVSGQKTDKGDASGSRNWGQTQLFTV